MNYKSRKFVDLHVIDAINVKAIKDWGLEVDALRSRLKGTKIAIYGHRVTDLASFIQVLNEIRIFRKSYVHARHAVPYIHISCHGRKDAIEIGESQKVSWPVLSAALLPLLETTDYHVAISLSSCWGYHGGALAYVMSTNYTKKRPYYSLVGPPNKERIPDLFDTYAEFYRQLLGNFRKLKKAIQLANEVNSAKLSYTKGSEIQYDD